MYKLYNFPLGKLILVIFSVGLLLLSIFYLNTRWEKIRDIRRQADAKTIIKALQYYYNFYNEFPPSSDDDGEGWDKSNDLADRDFLKPLVDKGILAFQPFDPKNNQQYYYRYQKFPSGSFGCPRPFTVFQVIKFETSGLQPGVGNCQNINFIELAPQGFTWQDFE